MRTEHVLIIRFSALGDVAMAVPVVSSLAKEYPHVRFTMLSRPGMRPLFEGLAPNVSFMEADLKNEYHGVKGLNALYRRLTAKQFTAIADLHDVLRSEYLRLRFNMEMYKVAHIDKHRGGRRRLVASNEKKQLAQQPTVFQNYADVFARLGYPVQVKFTSLFPPEGGDMSAIPETIEPKRGPWIGIAPFAAHAGKIYPRPLMEVVMAQLTEHRHDCRLFLFGGGSEEQAVFREWCAKFPQCISVPDHVRGLRKELILMSHLDVMLSMDSANVHLASLAATPVITIWGSTHPYAGFMGWAQDKGNNVQLDLRCRPCSIYGNRKCLRGDMACLKNIPPELIVAKTEAVMRRKASTLPS